ncbi:MAG TPA: 30S ribosomal protein S13 [Candidatus Paceibacterota bacterium]|nr:30S ribosomal protein S13 [Candidatus Paceibacterota bacterium]
MEKIQDKVNKGKEEVAKKYEEKSKNEVLVRILSTDIPGSKNVYIGLTRIRGISYNISNAILHILKLDKNRKISSLSKEEIELISKTIKELKIPEFLMNRRKDYDTGESKHLTSTELDLRKEFDIKRLKKIKSYKGIRHTRGLPVRGQRTKSHFRKKGKKKAVGVNKK